ncbi:hypothetical protein H0H92_007241 [Tricholoma furcatifolium]|nr:hypothetical protein H0H92_007241 [Tricholoma furcatifolium]
MRGFGSTHTTSPIMTSTPLTSSPFKPRIPPPSHFASLHELLRCLHDFVPVRPTDHKSSYNKLYLQRDISIRNLLVFEVAAGETFGRLVDYDHAKKAEGSKEIFRHKFKDEAFQIDRTFATLAEESDSRWQVEAAVALEAATCVAHPVFGGYYLFDVIKNNSSLAEKAATSPLSMDDVHWTETGTLPFMSAEVIQGSSLITPVGFDVAPPFTHQAIHDMESLFWVLVYLCMTRKGPGTGMRRDELNVTNPDVDLSRALIQYFDGNKHALLSEKGDLLRRPELIEKKRVAPPATRSPAQADDSIDELKLP